jgi:polyvinyl alcohol dehydrogenase (cytochrome)
MTRRLSAFACLILAVAYAGPREPAEIYTTTCAKCHEGAVPTAPHAVEFQMLGPRAILNALDSGVMQAVGATLTPTERRSVAEFLGASTLPGNGVDTLKHCDSAHARFEPNSPPPFAGASLTLEGTRYVDRRVAELDEQSVPRLKLKWAFEFPGATRARSQPTVGGGALYVGSQDGTVYALDFATGCVRWTFGAKAEVRTSPVLEGWSRGDRDARPRLWFADFNGNAYALDARTGRQLWMARVADHPRLTITGSPRYYEGRLYVPMSSTEWAAAANPGYECCTFRGGIAALDATTGTVIWHAYSIPEEARATGERNSAGAERYTPSGAPVWNIPTIDVKRRRLYIGSGESYTSPAAPQSDAVIAYDLDSGRMLWWYQSTAHDAWNMACFIGGGPNCPAENGPDLDVGAPPILYHFGRGRDLLLAGAKSADVFALNPDDGTLVWRNKYGSGGYAGGVHWGMASTRSTLYAPITDIMFLPSERGTPMPGLNALDPATGKIKWFAPAPDVCPVSKRPACDRGFSPPPTAIPGVVLQPAYDGWLRALRESDGKLLWSFDTTQTVETVSGARAHGGSIDSVGAVVAYGRVVMSSGYLFGGRMPGNVLLVFSVDGK